MSEGDPHLCLQLPPLEAREVMPRSVSRSPVRREGSSSLKIKEEYHNLSPSAPGTIAAAETSTSETWGVSPDLLESLKDASASEKQFATRASRTLSLLREWCQELQDWPWSGNFQGPPPNNGIPQDNFRLESEISDSMRDGDGRNMTDTAVKHDLWGSLPMQSLVAYERRLDLIQESLEALNIQEQQDHILNDHLQCSSSMPQDGTEALSESPPHTGLGGVTAMVTMTILQALPYYSRLLSLMDGWRARLIVFKQVPSFMQEIKCAQTALDAAWMAIGIQIDRSSAVHGAETIALASRGMFRDTFDAIRDDLEDKVAILGQRMDAMLDLLEGHEDALPDKWIDAVEECEIDYSNWIVEAQRKVLENENRFELIQHHSAGDSNDVGCKDEDLDIFEARKQKRERMPGSWSDAEDDEQQNLHEIHLADQELCSPKLEVGSKVHYPSQPNLSSASQAEEGFNRNGAVFERVQHSQFPRPPLTHSDLLKEASERFSDEDDLSEVETDDMTVEVQVPKEHYEQKTKQAKVPQDDHQSADADVQHRPFYSSNLESLNQDPDLLPNTDQTNPEPASTRTDQMSEWPARQSNTSKEGEQPTSGTNNEYSYQKNNSRTIYRRASMARIGSFPRSQVKSIELGRSMSAAVPATNGARRSAQEISNAISPLGRADSLPSLRTSDRAASSLKSHRLTPNGQSEDVPASRISDSLIDPRAFDTLDRLQQGVSMAGGHVESMLELGTLKSSSAPNIHESDSACGRESSDSSSKSLSICEANGLGITDKVNTSIHKPSSEAQQSPQPQENLVKHRPPSLVLVTSLLPLLIGTSVSLKTLMDCEGAYSHTSTEVALERQIENILGTMPARISFNKDTQSTFASAPHRTLDSTPPLTSASSAPASPASLRTDMDTGMQTYEFTLTPASPKDLQRQRLDVRSGIKLYYLTHVGKTKPMKLFVRLVGRSGERVMVRVGGGWTDLGDFLRQYIAHHGRTRTLEHFNFEPSGTANPTIAEEGKSVFSTEPADIGKISDSPQIFNLPKSSHTVDLSNVLKGPTVPPIRGLMGERRSSLHSIRSLL